MKKITAAQAVDALGKLRARISELELEEKALCALIKESGGEHIAGKLYEATVYQSTKVTVDMEVVRSTLNPQFLADHTTRTPYTSVKVTPIKPLGKKD